MWVQPSEACQVDSTILNKKKKVILGQNVVTLSELRKAEPSKKVMTVSLLQGLCS